MLNVKVEAFCFDPEPVKIEQDVAVPTGKCILESKLQDCPKHQNFQKVNDTQTSSYYGDSLTNMTIGCNSSKSILHLGIDKNHYRCFRDNSYIKGFPQKLDHTRHIVSHTGDKPHICDFCGKHFCRKFNLNQHILIHTGNKPHICNFCGKSFSQKSHLKDHMLTHTGDKPHICNFCEKSFSRRSDLKIHILTHTGDKPHTCNFCGKRFSRKSNLNQHIITHKSNKPHIRNFCGKSLSQKSNHTKHIVTHTGDKPHIYAISVTKVSVGNQILTNI